MSKYCLNRAALHAATIMSLAACSEPPGSSLARSSQPDVIVAAQAAIVRKTADEVHSAYNLTGRGVRIALLDTGVDLSHPDLKDAVIAQHCFLTGGSCGAVLANEGMNAQDDNGHGTNVAGVIASRGLVSPAGFAPDAQIVAVKVSRDDNSSTVLDWANGLDWVYDNLSTLGVRVVVLGPGTAGLLAQVDQCDLLEPMFAQTIARLLDSGVTVFAAAGNMGSASQVAAPACNTGVIAVGASYESAAGPQPGAGLTYMDKVGRQYARCTDDATEADQITCFTNSGPRLDLIAPGAAIVTDALGGGVETTWGTSEAAAAAAGVAALMLECKPNLTPAEIKAALLSSSVSRLDPKSSMTYPVIRPLEAVRAVCPTLTVDAGVPAPSSIPDAGAAAPSMPTGPGQPINTAARIEAALGSRYVAGARAPQLVRQAGGTGGMPQPPSAKPRADRGKAGSGGTTLAMPQPAAQRRSDAGCACITLRGDERATGVWAFIGCVFVAKWRASRRRAQPSVATQV